MPYPDHFARNGTYRPWEHPYETLLDWAESAAKRQAETPTPAVDRTWIQAYNAIQPPYNEYGVQEIGDEIRALREEGLPAASWHGTPPAVSPSSKSCARCTRRWNRANLCRACSKGR